MLGKAPIVKRPPKTLKERRFVKALVTAPSAAEAARIAGYKDPIQSAYENQIKLDIKGVLDKAGITDDLLVEDLKEGLKSTKVISAMVFADGKSGKPVNDFIDVPDFMVRHKWWTSAMQLKGYLGRSDEGGTTNNYLQFIQNQNNGYRPENPV